MSRINGFSVRQVFKEFDLGSTIKEAESKGFEAFTIERGNNKQFPELLCIKNELLNKLITLRRFGHIKQYYYTFSDYKNYVSGWVIVRKWNELIELIQLYKTFKEQKIRCNVRNLYGPKNNWAFGTSFKNIDFTRILHEAEKEKLQAISVKYGQLDGEYIKRIFIHQNLFQRLAEAGILGFKDTDEISYFDHEWHEVGAAPDEYWKDTLKLLDQVEPTTVRCVVRSIL